MAHLQFLTLTLLASLPCPTTLGTSQRVGAQLFSGRMATFDGGLLCRPRHDDEGAPGTVHEQESDGQHITAPLSLS